MFNAIMTRLGYEKRPTRATPMLWWRSSQAERLARQRLSRLRRRRSNHAPDWWVGLSRVAR